MRIGVDARFLSRPLTGIGRYVFEICKHLEEFLPRARFFLYSPLPLKQGLFSDRWVVRVDPLPFPGSLIFPWATWRVSALCKRDYIDAYWAIQAPFIPNLGGRVNLVSTVHDLHYRVAPQTMKWHVRAIFRLFEGRYKLAHALVAASHGTASRLNEILGLRAATVVPPAVADAFRPLPEAEVELRLRKYNIARPYLLAIGIADPRKNVGLLIRVVLEMKRQGLLGGVSLVIVGGKRTKSLNVNRQRLRPQWDNKEVRLIGYVPDEDLAALYTGSEALVFPSIYEGFGIPVAEALACGTKVVASDLPELREAGGEYPIFVEPTFEGIWQGLLEVLKSSRSRKVVQPSWTWRDGARRMASLLSGERL